MQKRVISIEQRPGSNGPFHKIRLDGDQYGYNCFDTLPEGVVVGAMIEAEIQEKPKPAGGTYKNYTNIKVVSVAPPVSSPPAASQDVSGGTGVSPTPYQDDRSAAITLAVAFKGVCQLHAGSDLAVVDVWDEVLTAYRALMAGDVPMAAAKADGVPPSDTDVQPF